MLVTNTAYVLVVHLELLFQHAAFLEHGVCRLRNREMLHNVVFHNSQKNNQMKGLPAHPFHCGRHHTDLSGEDVDDMNAAADHAFLILRSGAEKKNTKRQSQKNVGSSAQGAVQGRSRCWARTNERTNERMNARTNARTNERTNERGPNTHVDDGLGTDHTARPLVVHHNHVALVKKAGVLRVSADVSPAKACFRHVAFCGWVFRRGGGSAIHFRRSRQ